MKRSNLIMKLSGLICGLALTATACSSSKNEKGGGLPADIPFNEKALPQISEADFVQAQAVAKNTGEAAAPMVQILTKNDESNDDRRKREQKFQALKPEVQTLVRRWQIDCKPNHVKDGKGIEGKPEVGRVYKKVESVEATGAQCPVTMNEKSETQFTVTRFSQNPVNVAMSYSSAGSARTVFNNTADQQTIGAAGFAMTLTMSGRLERVGETESGYGRIDGKGDMASLLHGPVAIQITTENLARPGLEKSLTTVNVNQGGKTFVFTQYLDKEEKSKAGPRYFIGHRELTLAEVRAMGEFPFAPNETIPRGR